MALRGFVSAKRLGSASDANGVINGGSVGYTIDTTAGRDGGRAFVFNQFGEGHIGIQLPSSLGAGDKVVFGFHAKITSGLLNANKLVLQGGLQTAITTNIRGGLHWNTDGTLAWFSGTNTTRATSTLTLNTGEDYFIEGEIILRTDATGSVHIKVDGVDFIGGGSSVSGDNLITVSTADIQTVRVRKGNTGTSNVMTTDVFYVCDGSGSINNTFLGNVHSRLLVPVADTADADFTPSTGSENYAMVSEAAPDGDTTYNASDNPGDTDLFTHTGGILSDNIFGVIYSIRARKEAAGTIGVKGVLRSGSATDKTTLAVPTTSYQTYQKLLETDPDTSGAWTADGVNNAKIGYEATVTP